MKPAVSSAPRPAHVRTLVVDDSALVRRAVRRHLEAHGHEVATASSGEEGFELALRESFDLVVSDVTMGAVSGVHLCRMLRDEPLTRDVPIVLLTANDDPRSRFWGRSGGANAHVAKDHMQDGLMTAVREVLDGRGPRPERTPSTLRVDPLARMSRVLDEQLFAAVVMGRVLELADCVQDRRLLLRRTLELFSEVLGCAYVVLHLQQPRPSVALVSRCGEPNLDALRPRLAVAENAVVERVLAIDDPRCRARGDAPGERHTSPIRGGTTSLGELHVHSASGTGLSPRERETCDLLARALGSIYNSLFLLEATRRMATTDALTGLANRGSGSERLAQEVARARRYGPPLSVALLDIDHFKKVNDTFGHAMGDKVLVAVAEALGDALRNTDVAIRWGGEEFLVLLPRTAAGGARTAGDRLRAAIAAIPPFDGGPERVTVSVGVTAFVEGDSPESIVDRADIALYDAKAQGRDQVIVRS